jgi:putative endonuclease
MWHVYFLRLRNADTYIGFTSNLRRRLADHTTGQVTFTSQLRPLTLTAYIAVETEPTARALEKYFKSGSGNAFAKKRILKRPAADRRLATVRITMDTNA